MKAEVASSLYPSCLVVSEVLCLGKSVKPLHEDSKTLRQTTQVASSCQRRWRTAEGCFMQAKTETSKNVTLNVPILEENPSRWYSNTSVTYARAPHYTCPICKLISYHYT